MMEKTRNIIVGKEDDKLTKQYKEKYRKLSGPHHLSPYSYSPRAGWSVDRIMMALPHPSGRIWRPSSLLNNV